ncbi:putative methionyl-tRNA synthetase [Hordeum vulgare]|nr:putative methionyl-tRNA synthetase [Hordeum vulgare]
MLPKKEYTFPRPASAVDSSQAKQRKPMPRPAGISDAEWKAEVQRRESVTTDRRRRLNAKKIKDAAAVNEEEVSRAGMMNPRGRRPQAALTGLQGVAPATLSPTMPPKGYVPSRGYYDGDAQGGFNPNTTFPHGAQECSSPIGFSHDPRTPSPTFSVGLNTQYNYLSSVYSSAASPAPSLHRVVLPLAPTPSLQFNYADADMHEIMTSGFVVAASHPEFGVHDETMDTTSDIDDELNDARRRMGRKRRQRWNRS